LNIKNPILSIKELIKRLKDRPRQDDDLIVVLPGFGIRLRRSLDIYVPHEVTLVIPRAEVRKKCLNADCSQYELEMIYSNITVSHSPRHRPTGMPGAPPVQPGEAPSETPPRKGPEAGSRRP